MRLVTGALLACSALGALATEADLHVSFRPQDLPKKSASCKALNRAEGEIKDITIEYVEVNPEAEQTILMVHGWPSLWHSWKYQIEEFKDDYHLVIPNHRGFGSSTSPGDVKTSGQWADLVQDLACVLDDAGVSSAICMGHDWGSSLCYQFARQRPDLITAVIGVAVPYLPNAGPYTPTSALASHFPRLAYQIFLGETPELAAAELDADVRRSLRATLRSVGSPSTKDFLTSTESFLVAYEGVEEIPPIPYLTKEEEDYWVEQYSIQGFGNTLMFYTPGCQRGSWGFIQSQGNFTIPVPALSVLPSHDPVANWVLVAQAMRSADYVPNLTTQVMDGSHWPHLEHPREFNRIARVWLEGLPIKEKILAKQEEQAEEEELLQEEILLEELAEEEELLEEEEALEEEQAQEEHVQVQEHFRLDDEL